MASIPRTIVAFDEERSELFLGGMLLVAKRGDVDIYETANSTIIPTIRIQRADLDDVIAFLQRAKWGAA